MLIFDHQEIITATAGREWARGGVKCATRDGPAALSRPVRDHQGRLGAALMQGIAESNSPSTVGVYIGSDSNVSSARDHLLLTRNRQISSGVLRTRVGCILGY